MLFLAGDERRAISIPGQPAPASLKPTIHGATESPADRIPGQPAPASLKLRHSSNPCVWAEAHSGAACPGLIEAGGVEQLDLVRHAAHSGAACPGLIEAQRWKATLRITSGRIPGQPAPASLKLKTGNLGR